MQPKRVRHPTDRWFTFRCSPPCLAATQLLQVSGRRRLPGGDLHPSDSAPRRRTRSGPCPRNPPTKKGKGVPEQHPCPQHPYSLNPYSLTTFTLIVSPPQRQSGRAAAEKTPEVNNIAGMARSYRKIRRFRDVLGHGSRPHPPFPPKCPPPAVDTVFRRKRYFHNLLDMGSGF